ncbi:carbohydrate ABC transporter permease [Paractinoplanes lichenicola]|uniref:Carbohydrate ABC transporter permease n=1 Tax=Paractinoplanes lichenicola TaxID=2802976 RepID=A0ABS1VFI1_9ACTN|nr:carbohydrate ABC transporter permease [Actinoplanes lichenicola]MBL7253251.1 carbohydrate ABC transporter permease [Actinoplanes lichenicola]
MTTVSRPPWMARPSWPVQALKAVVIGAIVLVMLYPLVYVVATSFSADTGTVAGTGLLPEHYSLQAYRSIFAGNVVLRSLLVSIGVTLIGTALSMVVSIGMAWGLSRTRDVPGSRFVLYAVLGTMLFTSGIIPNYLLVKSLGLLDSYWSMVLPVVANAFNIVVLRNFFMEIPRDLIDSAKMDGASEWQVLVRIALPLSKAVLAVIALFYAVGYWNDFFNALIYVNDHAKWPIQLVLNQYVVLGESINQAGPPTTAHLPVESLKMAVVVIATAPILVVYPFLQRYFTKGMLTGAIKG